MKQALQKEHLLRELLSQKKKVIIAFSGGVDSTYLLHIASSTPNVKVIAATIKSPLHMKSEGVFAKKFVEQIGVEHHLYELPLLEYENVYSNSPDRCYHCKKLIFSFIKEKLAAYHDYTFADGTNIDDFSDYRPGLRACKELEIWHPLAKAQLSKKEIYFLSEKHQLPTANKPPFACLASRIPYGVKLTEDNLNSVQLAEEYLETLGFSQYRVRHHGDIARIELYESDFSRIITPAMRKKVVSRFMDIGYTYVTIDLRGYRQGSMNIKITDK